MAEELVISSTTDPQQVVEGAVQSDPESGRAEVAESSLADFRESESADGGTVSVSVESSQSERQMLLERLAEAEQEVQLLPEAPDAAGQAVDESGLNATEREMIRQQAVQDALEDARMAYRQQPAYSSPEEQTRLSEAELGAAREQWSQAFWNRMGELHEQHNTNQLLDEALASGVGISNAVTDTLLAVGNGPEAFVHLLKNPQERARLLRLPDHLACASVADLAARLAQPPRRQRSNAPEPIVPLGGSRTRSSLPPDAMSYQDYSKYRERQIRAKRGR